MSENTQDETPKPARSKIDLLASRQINEVRKDTADAAIEMGQELLALGIKLNQPHGAMDSDEFSRCATGAIAVGIAILEASRKVATISLHHATGNIAVFERDEHVEHEENESIPEYSVQHGARLRREAVKTPDPSTN